MAGSGERPLSQVARELGIRPAMLATWTRQAERRAGLIHEHGKRIGDRPVGAL